MNITTCRFDQASAAPPVTDGTYTQQATLRRLLTNSSYLCFWIEVPIAPSMYMIRSSMSNSSCPNAGDFCRGSRHALYTGTGGSSAGGARGSTSAWMGFSFGGRLSVRSFLTSVGLHLGSKVAANSSMRSVAFSQRLRSTSSMKPSSSLSSLLYWSAMTCAQTVSCQVQTVRSRTCSMKCL